MNTDQIYKAWQAVGADIAGLKWEDFAKHLPQQPAQQEPVTCEWWEHTSPVTGIKDVQDWQLTEADKAAGWIEKSLYTSPPQRTWVGLTDEEIYMHCPNWLSQEQCKAWIQQVEAKLKEKNT